MPIAAIAGLHANADLLVGLLIGFGIGLVVGPLLRAWLTFLEWTQASREAQLTEDLITRLDRDLDELSEQSRSDARIPRGEGTWRTSH